MKKFTKPKNPHGGARPGAGRKPTGAARILIAARVPQDSANRIYSAAVKRNAASPATGLADVLHDFAQRHLPPPTVVHPALTKQTEPGKSPE